MASKYPAKLSEKIRELSEEKDDDMKMYMEWRFQGIEDTGEASSECPCGYSGIRYLCHIKNEITDESIDVGRRCMLLFDDEMQDVLEFVHGLISTGIRGQYKGISYHEKTNTEKYRFEIEEDTSLVKKSEFLNRHVDSLSIYQKGNGKWEMQVFFEISIPDLQEECFYHLRMKSSRWKKDYGDGMKTGITFRVIECSEEETE